jgi:hypothetical protein
MGWKGFRDVRATIIINIENKTKEQLLAGCDRSRRKNIARADSFNLIFKEADEGEWNDYYEIHCKVWRAGGVNPMPRNELKKENYRLFVAKHENKVAGGGVVAVSESGM